MFSFQKIRKEFDGFEQLFARFLRESGSPIDWGKINLLNQEAVRILLFSLIHRFSLKYLIKPLIMS